MVVSIPMWMMPYFCAIFLARVVLPDFALPMISNCNGVSLAYSKMSFLKGSSLSFGKISSLLIHLSKLTTLSYSSDTRNLSLRNATCCLSLSSF